MTILVVYSFTDRCRCKSHLFPIRIIGNSSPSFIRSICLCNRYISGILFIKYQKIKLTESNIYKIK